MQRELWDGRLIAAARALAGLTTDELGAAAGVTRRTISRLELGGVIHVSEKIRHGHVSQDVWGKITDALAKHGIELLPEGGSCGSGVRWTRPRENRQT